MLSSGINIRYSLRNTMPTLQPICKCPHIPVVFFESVDHSRLVVVCLEDSDQYLCKPFDGHIAQVARFTCGVHHFDQELFPVLGLYAYVIG